MIPALLTSTGSTVDADQHNLLREGAHGTGVALVQRQVVDTGMPARHGFQHLRATPGDDHLVARPVQRCGRACADAAAATGDEDRVACEQVMRPSLPTGRVDQPCSSYEGGEKSSSIDVNTYSHPHD